MEEKKSNKKFWIIGGIILLIIIAVVIFIVVKNRKKKKLSESKDRYLQDDPRSGQRPRTTPERPNQGAQTPSGPQHKKFEENKPTNTGPAKPVKETLPLDKPETNANNPVMKNSNLSDTRLGSGSGPVQTDAPFVDMVDAANPPQQ